MTYFYHNKTVTWIRVTGEDTSAFLQSQFSNELQQTQSNPIIYGLWLTRKGKTCADSFVFQNAENDFLIFSYFCSAQTIINKLEENLVADDVELKNLSSSVTALSWWGENAASFISYLGLEEPILGSYVEISGKYLMRGRRSAEQNYDLIIPIDQTETIESKIEAYIGSEKASRATHEALHWERLKSCIPAIPNDIGPNDLPQEGELENDALSFDKGCFLGQEVMARIHSMGQVQRKLFSVHSEIPLPPTLPCDLYNQEKIVGQLRSAAGDGKSWIGHALLKNRGLEKLAGLSLKANDTPGIFIGKSQKVKRSKSQKG